MEFLSDYLYYFVLMGLAISFIIDRKFIEPKKGIKASLQFQLYAYGLAMLILSSSIPHISSGSPDELSDLENKKMLLDHLKKNNDALSETIYVLREMAFISLIAFLPILIRIIGYLKVDKTKKS